MALTPVITHATGDVFPAADWNTYIRDNVNYVVTAGVDLASASTMVTTNEFHVVSGTATITNISPAVTPVKGQQVRLFFQGALTIQNNAGGTGNIRTLTGGDRVTRANDSVAFVYDGAAWREQNNAYAAFGGPVAASLTALNALFTGGIPDGARAVIRPAGGRDLPLVWDAGFAHWVSEPFPLGGNNITNGTGNTFATPIGSGGGVDWDFVQTAGLTLQVKWSGIGITSNAGSAMHGGVYIIFGNFTSGFTTSTQLDSSTTSLTGGAVGVDWTTVTNPGAYEVASVGLYQFNAAGGNNASVQGAVVGRLIG